MISYERKLFETKDYNILKTLKGNRNIEPRHVAKLCWSMKQKNMLKDYPIIVNKDMEILDGQHRWEAAKLLQMPIIFIIAEDMENKDISTVNNISMKWKPINYVLDYASKGNVNYIKLVDFYNKTKLPIISCIQILESCTLIRGASKEVISKNEGISKTVLHVYQIGQFIYPNDDKFAYDFIDFIKNFQDKPFYLTKSFLRSLQILFFDRNDIDKNKFIAKYKNSYELEKQRDVKCYIEKFFKIYNHKERIRIAV